jgi:hypothetical protein
MRAVVVCGHTVILGSRSWRSRSSARAAPDGVELSASCGVPKFGYACKSACCLRGHGSAPHTRTARSRWPPRSLAGPYQPCGMRSGPTTLPKVPAYKRPLSHGPSSCRRRWCPMRSRGCHPRRAGHLPHPHTLRARRASLPPGLQPLHVPELRDVEKDALADDSGTLGTDVERGGSGRLDHLGRVPPVVREAVSAVREVSGGGDPLLRRGALPRRLPRRRTG